MREYETGVTMTSRFGKTYSRKGGNGSSKFDEVFNKRATLSTKWGETTYKAQVGQKRPHMKPEVSEIPKKSKVEDGVSDDPFGFDSDEESVPVASRSTSQTKSSSPQPAESMKTAPLENFAPVLEASSTTSRPVGGDKIISSKSTSSVSTLQGLNEKSTNQSLEDGDDNMFSTKVSLADEKPQNWVYESTENSCPTYRNATESEKKPNFQATNFMGHTIENDSLLIWDSECPPEMFQSSGLQRTAQYGLGTHVEETRTDESLLNFYSEPHEEEKSNKTDMLDYTEEPLYLPDISKKCLNKQPAKEGARKIFSGPKRSPTKAVYNARHWNHPDQEELPAPPVSRSQTVPASAASKEVASNKDDGVFKAPAPPPKVTKTVTIPTQPNQEIITTLRCRKEDKELYTVVQHVKHFNDVVEFGENQEFSDDIEYLLSGLKSNQPLNTRCLSVISLATKCAMPSFRMHLRAHGMVAMVFKTLGDAQQYQNLALCTAALMYILSRDRLNMDLDRASLDLMIRLLEMEQDPSAHQQLSDKEMNKVKEKIRKLCETVHNKHLDLENITTGHLAMETLLSLTSKRAGDWFKEELRLLGGLDHIVDKVKECAEHLDIEDEEDKLYAYLWGAERCLRVLESVTVHNPENQSYLIAYKDSQLIVSSARALQHCEELIQRYNRADDISAADKKIYHNASSHVGKAVEDCMRAIFGVLLNLTNDNEWGSTKTGEQDNLISTVLDCVLQVPQYLPQEQRFDIRVLGLGLLINLVEYSARNRHCLVDMETSWSFDSFCAGDEDDSLRIVGSVSAIRALVQLFLQRERAAQLAESQTDDFIKDAPTAQHDKSGEWQETSGEIQWVATEKGNEDTNERDTNATNETDKKEEEDEELDLNKALQHAGKHMEDCIVASYTALLLGCLCQDSPMNVTTVREALPEGDFSIMTEMLRKFLNFMNLTCAVGTTGQKSISRVIEYLEHC